MKGHEQGGRKEVSNPLSGRPGLRTESAKTNRLAKDIGELARRHRLTGCVLISFTSERVGVNSSGKGEFADHMARLADQLLAAIDDGMYEPEVSGNSRADQIERIAQRVYDLRDSAPVEDKKQWKILDGLAGLLSQFSGKLVKADGARKGGTQ
jgi:hypothetical protein